jgi:hypothetical protein
MSRQEINSQFEGKIMGLQNAIEKNISPDEERSRRELLPPDIFMLIRNMRDLYGVNKLIFNMLLEFRDKVDNMKHESDVRIQLVELKNAYNEKFEKLEERLRRINAKDEEEKENGEG